MKTTIITEFVKFKSLETTTEEQLLSKVEFLSNFQKPLDGYIDAELIKNMNENEWCIVYHYENMEKAKLIGEKMRNAKIFAEFMPYIAPDSIKITFYNSLKKF